jgi:hypothetical protein
MSNKLLFASLLALTASTTASQAQQAPTPAPMPVPVRPPVLVCEPGIAGPQDRFEIDSVQDRAKPTTKTSLVLTSNGSWIYTATTNGRLTRVASGCIAYGQVRTIDNALSRAKWQTSVAEFRCMAIGMGYTEYKVNGKVVLHREVCDGLELDDASQQSLTTITQILDGLVANR